jgi:chromate transporter
MMWLTLWQLALLFSTLSLLAVGGGNGVIPDMQRASVNLHHWMTDSQFLDLFAISRASPGPGSLIVVLIGQKAAGLVGAFVAGVAMYTPSCLAVHLASRAWRRFQAATWRQTIEHALMPIAVGLTYASGLALLRGTEHGWVAYAVTAVSAVVLAVSELHPLAVLAAGAAVTLVL